MRLMSASIAATAVITAVRAAIRPDPAIPSLALIALSMKATVSARGRHGARVLPPAPFRLAVPS